MLRGLVFAAAAAAAAAAAVEADAEPRRVAAAFRGLNASWLLESMESGGSFVVRGESYGASRHDALRSKLTSTLVEPFRERWHEPHASLRGDGGARVAATAARAVDDVEGSSSIVSAVLRLETLGAAEEGGGGAAAGAGAEEEEDAAAAAATEAVGALFPEAVFSRARGDTAHVYVSSPGAAALANHTDVTDVLVLQLRGAKAWRVCDAAQPALGDGKLDTCATYDAGEMASLRRCDDVALRAGDVLFIPRRSVHSARAAGGAPSTHLTLGLRTEGRRRRGCRGGGGAGGRRETSTGLGFPERRLQAGSCDSVATWCPTNYYSSVWSTGTYYGTNCNGCDEDSCDFCVFCWSSSGPTTPRTSTGTRRATRRPTPTSSRPCAGSPTTSSARRRSGRRSRRRSSRPTRSGRTRT